MSHITAEQQSQLLAHLYSGAIEYGHWTDVLRILTETFDAVNCSLATVDTRTGKSIVQYTSRTFDRSWYESYSERYARVSPLRPVLFKRENIGRAMTTSQIMQPQDFENTEFYCDYLSQYDIRHVLGSVFKVGDGRAAYIALHRSLRSADFDAGEVDAIQNLLPHLKLAFRIRSHCMGLSRYEDVSQQYLDSKGKGLICLDRYSRIVSMNREAERILRLNDGLTITQDHLLASNRDDNARLQALISQSCQTETTTPGTTDTATGGSAIAHRTAGGQPYALWVFPVAGRSMHFEDNQIAAAIEITDPLRSDAAGPEGALAGYGLTRAEMRLAQALIEGAQLKDIAQRFDVSVNTLKVQRRSLYRKIGATRHFDLMRLVRHRH